MTDVTTEEEPNSFEIAKLEFELEKTESPPEHLEPGGWCGKCDSPIDDYGRCGCDYK